MFFINSILKCIKYIFFLQLLYSNKILATEQDFRSSPEVGIENQKNTSAKSRKKHGWKYKERQRKLYWENPEKYREASRQWTSNMTD